MSSRFSGGLLIAAALAILVASQASPAAAVASPSPCPSPAASGSRCVTPSSSEYDQLKLRLSADLAAALSTQQQLSAAVAQASATALLLADELTQEEARITELQDKAAAGSVLVVQSEKSFVAEYLANGQPWDVRRYSRNQLALWRKPVVLS